MKGKQERVCVCVGVRASHCYGCLRHVVSDKAHTLIEVGYHGSIPFLAAAHDGGKKEANIAMDIVSRAPFLSATHDAKGKRNLGERESE